MTATTTVVAATLWAAPIAGVGDASLMQGWLPALIQVVTAAALALAIGVRNRRWWTRWIPIAAAVGIGVVLASRWFVASEGMAGEPAPLLLWMWIGFSGFAISVIILGWKGSGWSRRSASLLAVPLCALCAVLALNMWVGYARTVQAAWGFLTLGPVPNEIDMATATAMARKGEIPRKGRIVPVNISAEASGFKHRGELVYLPPVWFTSSPPPKLPTVMMIGGEFGSTADWLWAGNAAETIDAFVAEHDGQAPVFVFVDKGGAFNKDTECVNGSRGKAADHLTEDVVPFMISTFGVSPHAVNWGVAGWSMGGTCAIDLTVMHPELFSTFVDIAGDVSPNVGTREQTIDRLFGGDENAWVAFDPTTVMTRHGPYTGVSGLFAIEAPESGSDGSAVHARQAEAAQSLCALGSANGIDCSVVSYSGRHDWLFGADVFRRALPWLAGQIGAPGAPRLDQPTSQ